MSMAYMENVKTGAAATRRGAKKDPMALLAALREKDKTGSFETVVGRWKQIVENDSDYCDASLLYAARNYWTALERDDWKRRRAAIPPQETAEQRRSFEQQVQQTVQRVEQAILLNFVLSNGKKLRDCTGIECIKEGGWLTAVGRKVGKRLVGEVLSEKQVASLRK